jgi:squalene-hopene/tetraprenyl-beta-curcumene cyclase
MIGVRNARRAAALAVAVLVLSASVGPATASIADPQLEQRARSAIDRGLKWLRGQQQENGSWANHPGISALVLAAYMRSPRSYVEDDGPFIRDAVAYLRSLTKEDGGIYDRDLPVYNTALSIMALCATGNPDYAESIQQARNFLLGRQSDEGEGYTSTDKFYGGIGYGNDERPDLSNLQFALEGLRAGKLEKKDPAWDRAVQFLQRCQNRSESNDQSWAANDGGFVYYPGYSFVGDTTSYGSMTYAGVKSFIYAHLDRDDPRVQSAMDWIRNHYTLEENPGLGADGLYYYFHTFSKSLRVYGERVIVDAQGNRHDWAEDLARELLGRQDASGFWVNSESGRWWESNSVLVTAEAILALEEALADLGSSDDPCPTLTASEESIAKSGSQ